MVTDNKDERIWIAARLIQGQGQAVALGPADAGDGTTWLLYAEDRATMRRVSLALELCGDDHFADYQPQCVSRRDAEGMVRSIRAQPQGVRDMLNDQPFVGGLMRVGKLLAVNLAEQFYDVEKFQPEPIL